MRCVFFSLIVIIMSAMCEGRPPVKNQTIAIPDYYEKYTLSLGNPSAPIRVHAFFSFTCLSCLLFHQHHFPSIKQQFVDTGKVYWTFVPYVMDVDTLYVMAALATCKDPIKLKIFEIIMHQAINWTEDDNKDRIIKILEACGIPKLSSQAFFEECAYELVLRDAFNFQEAVNVDGTPTLFINGQEIPGVPGAKKLTKILTDLLNERKGAEHESD